MSCGTTKWPSASADFPGGSAGGPAARNRASELDRPCPGAAIAIEQATSQNASIQEPQVLPPSVVCIPGAERLDEAAALVLAQLLRHRGIGATAEKTNALSMSKVVSLELANTALACVCYLSQPSPAKIQHTVRGLRRTTDGGRVLLTLLGTEAVKPVESVSGALVTGGSFRATLDAIVQATSEQPIDAPGRTKAAATACGSQRSRKASGSTAAICTSHAITRSSSPCS